MDGREDLGPRAYSLVGHFDIVRDEEDIHSTRRASLGHAGPRCMPSGHADGRHAPACYLWPRCMLSLPPLSGHSAPAMPLSLSRATLGHAACRDGWADFRTLAAAAPLATLGHAACREGEREDNFERCTAEAALNAGQNGVSQTLSGRCIIQL